MSEKRLLFIAYHFPPIQGSTGVTRTLSFSKYLADWGWEVTVLTVNSSVYPDIREENIKLIPKNVRVVRAMAFDAQKHFSVMKKYPIILAIPDRVQSWIPFGFFKALKIIRKWKPQVIMSTYPIASAHCIGYLAHKITGVPWVADFRDPMAHDGYPSNPNIYKSFIKIEKLVFRNAAKVIVTTPGAAKLYANKFGQFPEQDIITISNGFDPDMFTIDRTGSDKLIKIDKCITLLHSGILYPSERDPRYLFIALYQLREEGYFVDKNIRLIFRGSGNNDLHLKQIDNFNLGGIVVMSPPLPYLDAISEMSDATGLLLLQAANCNHQIPAKLYEYLNCLKPILALTDKRGDTAALMQDLGSPYIANLDDVEAIKNTIKKFISDIIKNEPFIIPEVSVKEFSRKALTERLADVLNQFIVQ